MVSGITNVKTEIAKKENKIIEIEER